MKMDDTISKFLDLNRKAKVDPELLELLEAYIGLKENDQEQVFDFYDPELKNSVSSRYPTVNRFLKSNGNLDSRIAQFLARYSEEMRKKQLPFIFDQSHFSSIFEVDVSLLEDVVANKFSYYRTFHISKNNKNGVRVIEAPSEALKELQRKLNKTVFSRISLTGYAHAYRRNRSIKTNASFHTNKEVVLRIDIKDYFHSFKKVDVSEYIAGLGYTKSVANLMSELVTYKGRMPMGAPTSPALSNLMSAVLDKRLAFLASSVDANYTRYADDLVFSSNRPNLPSLISLVYEILEEEGFRPNKKKTLVHRKWQRQVVTGIVVNDEIGVAKESYRNLRAVVHNCVNGSVHEQADRWGAKDISAFRNELYGKVGYVRYVKPSLGNKLLEKAKDINWFV